MISTEQILFLRGTPQVVSPPKLSEQSLKRIERGKEMVSLIKQGVDTVQLLKESTGMSRKGVQNILDSLLEDRKVGRTWVIKAGKRSEYHYKAGKQDD